MRKPFYTLPPTYRLSKHRGNGCFLEPPNHPRYFTRSIYTKFGNSPPYGRPQYEYKGTYFTELEDVDKLYKSLPLNHERTQAWITYLFGYFKNCYTDPSANETVIYPVPQYKLQSFVDDPRFSQEWREQEQTAIEIANMDIRRNASRIAKPDNHQAVRFIRKYYPDFKPSLSMLKLNGYGNRGTGNWWETLEKRPPPEECPGEDWQKHPVNGTWCQVCGWHQEELKEATTM